MRRAKSLIAAAGASAFLLAGAVAGPAGAAVVSGSSLSQPPNSSTCITVIISITCTVGVSTLPPANQAPGGTRAAIDGVIVAWSVRTGPSGVDHSIRLRVVRGTRGEGTGPLETLPMAAGVYTYAARMPVRAGDELGLDLVDTPELLAVPVVRSTTGASMDFWSPPLADGEERAPSTNAPDIELLMNATIEPDADGDGWGDETQDKCAGAGGANEGCPPPSSPPPPTPTPLLAPDTKIDKGPRGRISKRRATFRFSSPTAGATFRCKLDKRPYKPCRSPRTYKGLANGKHKFQVRAVLAGLVDPIPARRVFRVEP